jgi:hypothetical protein
MVEVMTARGRSKRRPTGLGHLGGRVAMSRAPDTRMKRFAMSVPSHLRREAENAHGPIASPTDATTPGAVVLERRGPALPGCTRPAPGGTPIWALGTPTAPTPCSRARADSMYLNTRAAGPRGRPAPSSP